MPFIDIVLPPRHSQCPRLHTNATPQWSRICLRLINSHQFTCYKGSLVQPTAKQSLWRQFWFRRNGPGCSIFSVQLPESIIAAFMETWQLCPDRRASWLCAAGHSLSLSLHCLLFVAWSRIPRSKLDEGRKQASYTEPFHCEPCV